MQRQPNVKQTPQRQRRTIQSTSIAEALAMRAIGAMWPRSSVRRSERCFWVAPFDAMKLPV